MSSTVSEFVVEVARSLFQRVPPTVNQPTRESTNSNTNDHSNLLPKNVSVVDVPTWESWTLTGSTKIQPTNTSKSFLSTHNTKLSDVMPVSTGSSTQYTNTVNLVVLLPLARRAEVLTRATDTTTQKLAEERLGRDTTLYLCGDTGEGFLLLLLCCLFFFFTIVGAWDFFFKCIFFVKQNLVFNISSRTNFSNTFFFHFQNSLWSSWRNEIYQSRIINF